MAELRKVTTKYKVIEVFRIYNSSDILETEVQSFVINNEVKIYWENER